MSAPPNEDDPTVIRTKSSFVPTAMETKTARTGRADSGSDDTLALPIGTQLGEFELTKRIGEGGFGIVYQAWDHTLERSIALKEYLPSSIATRVGATRISCRSDRHRETFEAGLKSFINEAKLLARFDHPSLVKVFRFWEANGTAYMVMPFYEGITMRDTVRAMAQPPDEAWLTTMLAALTEALLVIHREQCYHRDIAPDNVMLLHGSGRPLLLDFGAARRVIGDMTQALTVILKPGYAPVEQYAEVPGMKQGPWTDVYALAAVVYWCITGKTPPPAVGRMLSDTWVPLSQAAAGRYSERFLGAIDRALAVRPEQRTQDIHLLRADLGLDGSAAPAPPPVRPVDPEATVIRPPVRTQTRAQTVAAPAPPPESPPAKTLLASPPRRNEGARDSAAQAMPKPGSSKVGVGMGLAAAGVAALLAAGGWWWLRDTPKTPAPPPEAIGTPPPPKVATAPAPPPAPPPPLPRALARSPDEAIEMWLAARAPTIRLDGRVPATAAVAGKDALRVNLGSNRAGYAYLVARRAGSPELVLWHPAGLDAAPQRLEANVPREIGTVAAPAAGSWRAVAIVSDQPWDLKASGWQLKDGIATNALINGAATPAGCIGGVGPCTGEFGAEAFNIELQPEAKATVKAPPPPPPRATERPPEAKNPNVEECTRIIQQMSLGETSAALAARFKQLGCR